MFCCKENNLIYQKYKNNADGAIALFYFNTSINNKDIYFFSSINML